MRQLNTPYHLPSSIDAADKLEMLNRYGNQILNTRQGLTKSYDEFVEPDGEGEYDVLIAADDKDWYQLIIFIPAILHYGPHEERVDRVGDFFSLHPAFYDTYPAFVDNTYDVQYHPLQFWIAFPHSMQVREVDGERVNLPVVNQLRQGNKFVETYSEDDIVNKLYTQYDLGKLKNK